MKKLLLPVLMLVFGLGGGVAAGMFTQSPAADVADETADSPEAAADDIVDEDAPAEDGATEDATEDSDETSGAVEFLNMTNQFVIPLVDDGNVHGIVVMTISLEVVEGTIASVNLLQPKLRDQFLQVLFNHANNGGFDGNFTDFRYLKSLKEELLRNARVVAGRDVTDVLILDLVRQDP